jgi:uncharacterized membrane protein
MQIPQWALLLSFWLHMLATVVWLGGLAALALLVLPSMRRTLKPVDFASWVTALNERLDPLGWLCLGLLTFTGLVQMEANPNYPGLFNLSNVWAQAICLKHIAFVGMIAVSGYVTWSLTPALRRAAITRAKSRQANADQFLIRRFQLLVAVDLLFGLLILVFTALARVS